MRHVVFSRERENTRYCKIYDRGLVDTNFNQTQLVRQQHGCLSPALPIRTSVQPWRKFENCAAAIGASIDSRTIYISLRVENKTAAGRASVIFLTKGVQLMLDPTL